MLAHEALGKHFLEWVKKEASAEEDAAKTIGAPIAVLALNGVLFGFMVGFVKDTPRDFYVIILLALFIVSLSFMAMSLERIIVAIRATEYATPPDEERMIEHIVGEEYHLMHELELGEAEAKQRLERYIGKLYLDAYAVMIKTNRAVNARRTTARSDAIVHGCGALVATFASVMYLVARALAA
jgi:hypothetical protein